MSQIPKGATPRGRDRHKTPRASVKIPPMFKDKLTLLARRNRRLLRQELELAIEAHLVGAGLMEPGEGLE